MEDKKYLTKEESKLHNDAREKFYLSRKRNDPKAPNKCPICLKIFCTLDGADLSGTDVVCNCHRLNVIDKDKHICEACNLPSDALREGVLSQKGKKLCITCYYTTVDTEIQIKDKQIKELTDKEALKIMQDLNEKGHDIKWQSTVSIGNMGWVCPVCKTVNAPMNYMCVVCHPKPDPLK